MLILNGQVSIDALLKAKKQLDKAISCAESDLEKTGSIKCFEYCYELSWKTMKKILEASGVADINSPRSVFSAAYKNKLIDDLDVWNSFVYMRNLTSHTYNENLAEEVFDSLDNFAAYVEKFIDTIKKM